MTFGQYAKECELFEYSQEYFDVIKEESELKLMNLFIAQQQYVQEHFEYLCAEVNYIVESVEDDQLESIMEAAKEKKRGLINKLKNGLNNIFKNLASFFKNLWGRSNKNKGNRKSHISTINEAINMLNAEANGTDDDAASDNESDESSKDSSKLSWRERRRIKKRDRYAKRIKKWAEHPVKMVVGLMAAGAVSKAIGGALGIAATTTAAATAAVKGGASILESIDTDKLEAFLKTIAPDVNSAKALATLIQISLDDGSGNRYLTTDIKLVDLEMINDIESAIKKAANGNSFPDFKSLTNRSVYKLHILNATNSNKIVTKLGDILTLLSEIQAPEDADVSVSDSLKEFRKITLDTMNAYNEFYKLIIGVSNSIHDLDGVISDLPDDESDESSD